MIEATECPHDPATMSSNGLEARGDRPGGIRPNRDDKVTA